MGVVGPRHQLGKTMEWWLLSPALEPPQHSKGQSHSAHGTAGHPSQAGAQHLPHDSSEQLRLVEQQGHPCKGPRAPGQGETMAEEPQSGEGTGWAQLQGLTHLSRDAAVDLQAPSPCSTCSKQRQFALRTLLLEQFEGFKQTQSRS